MRLSEAAGLAREDVVLDADIPHVIIRPHPWRRLKTKCNERTLPLVGCALWSADKAVEASQHFPHLFRHQCNAKGCKASSASNALNKWLHANFRKDIVIHGFRHAMHDRLRAVSCPSEIIDQIGGWTTTGIGHAYGKGYSVEILAKWMQKIECY